MSPGGFRGQLPVSLLRGAVPRQEGITCRGFRKPFLTARVAGWGELTAVRGALSVAGEDCPGSFREEPRSTEQGSPLTCPESGHGLCILPVRAPWLEAWWRKQQGAPLGGKRSSNRTQASRPRPGQALRAQYGVAMQRERRGGPAVRVSWQERWSCVVLNSYLTSLCLLGKWAKDGTHLLRLSVIIMSSYSYLLLDSCWGRGGVTSLS